MFSFFGRSSEVRFDGYYQAEPYTDRQTVRNVGEFLDFGDREFLRFYPNGDCLKHWSTSDDIELILYSLDRKVSEIGRGMAWSGKYKVIQGEISMTFQSEFGQDIAGGIVLKNGSLKTDWRLNHIAHVGK